MNRHSFAAPFLRAIGFLVELKRDEINQAALEQIRRYMVAIPQHYPDHEILAFLVGMRCPEREALERKIGGQPIRILTFGLDIPFPAKATSCKYCGVGVSCDEGVCWHCKKRLSD
jgi:hypothetical protein